MDDNFEPTDTAPTSTVGDRLAAARRAQKLKLADITAQTRVPIRFLEMIEGGIKEGLPATPYSVGFVRTYAQMLGLDPAGMARDFRAELDSSAIVRPMHTPFEPVDPARVPSRSLALVALAVALIVALAYALWRSGILAGDTHEERARLATATVAEDAAPARPAAPALAVGPAPVPSGGPVVVTAIEPVWLRIYESQGERLLEKTMEVGERYELPATATDPMVLTGRPQALRIMVGAREIPALGPPERTIRDVSLKADALLARMAPPAPVAPASATP